MGLTGKISAGETSNSQMWTPKVNNKVPSVQSSEVEADSSNIVSLDTDGYESMEDKYAGFTDVLSSRQKKLARGKGPKLT